MTIIRKGEPMSDTISKKGVFIPDITVEMFRNASLESIEDLIASGEMEDILLPTAQPERKKGHWIEVDDHYNRISGRCSACGWESHLYEDDVVGMNFCPNCGADMREETDNG